MLNRIELIGHLGRDPETRLLPDGAQVVTMAVATTEKWKDKTSGERQEATEWHRCQVWGPLAGVAERYLRKGSLVYLSGSLRTRTWTDRDNVERRITEIRVDELRMLDRKGDRNPATSSPAPASTTPPPKTSPSSIDDLHDDIPF